MIVVFAAESLHIVWASVRRNPDVRYVRTLGGRLVTCLGGRGCTPPPNVTPDDRDVIVPRSRVSSGAQVEEPLSMDVSFCDQETVDPRRSKRIRDTTPSSEIVSKKTRRRQREGMGIEPRVDQPDPSHSSSLNRGNIEIEARESAGTSASLPPANAAPTNSSFIKHKNHGR